MDSFFEDFRESHKDSKAGDDPIDPNYIWHWDEYFLILFSNQQ